MSLNEVGAINEAELLRAALQQAPAASVTVAGESMAPLLRRGDLIGLAPLAAADARPGQIVTFLDPTVPGALQTHRVIGLQTAAGPLLFTRGDRVLTFDPPFSGDRLLGRVMWRQRDGRALALSEGRGLWLCEHLGRLAERERQWATGLRLPAQLDEAAVAASDSRARERVTALWVRALRLGSRAWSGFVSYLADFGAVPAPARGAEL